MSPLRKELEKHLKEMCQEMGFKKNRSRYYVKQISDDAYGTLGFSTASFRYKGHIFISCLAGVYYRPLEELLYRCGVSLDLKAIYPVLNHQIGYFTPTRKFYEWDYHDHADSAELFGEIKDTIIEYGYPVFQKYSDPDELLTAFQNAEVGMSTVSLVTGKAILYYLRGDRAKAMECLEERINIPKLYDNEEDERFEQNFRKLLSDEKI